MSVKQVISKYTHMQGEQDNGNKNIQFIAGEALILAKMIIKEKVIFISMVSLTTCITLLIVDPGRHLQINAKSKSQAFRSRSVCLTRDLIWVCCRSNSLSESREFH